MQPAISRKTAPVLSEIKFYKAKFCYQNRLVY